MTRPLVSGPAVVPVPIAGPDNSVAADQPVVSSADRPAVAAAGRVAARVRTAGGAVATAATRWWRHPPAALWGPGATAAVSAAIGMAADGPVAAAVLAAYGAAGFVIVRGAAARRAQRRARRLASDAVLGLAADLRAGSALGPAWRTAQEALRQAESGLLPGWRRPSRPGSDGPVALVVQRLLAATVLAEASGAPLAEVLERLDADLGALERARAAASTQAAGARASAAVLAVMPLAGIGLGVAVGVDPGHVLLHTPVGAAALGLAVVLQLAGLAWTARLSDIEGVS